MAQVNTILLELLKLFAGYEFEKLEKQNNGNYCTNILPAGNS